MSFEVVSPVIMKSPINWDFKVTKYTISFDQAKYIFTATEKSKAYNI